ncbi:MAG: excinuclease ABC subunit UvrC [Alphaproteobacteria bacterium]|nr:MAG: excinuclease ABC subunit UvrC [Alphaproteobacteria bacterium]
MTLKDQIHKAPNDPGVYKFLDQNQNILYIGKAKNLKNRLKSYLNTNELSHRISRMMKQAISVEITITQSELEALILESNLVSHLQPPFNILLKDDKSYAFLKIDTRHPFPSLTKYRGIPKGHKQEKFFGPYPQIDEALETVQKVFKLRNCSDYEFSIRKRPCIQYDIKRCTAPCVGYVSAEEYSHQVKRAMDFLEGKIAKILKELTEQMYAHSDALEFEKAAHVKHILSVIKKLHIKQQAHIVDIESCDILYIKPDGTLIQGIVRFHKYLGSQIFYMEYSGPEAVEDFITQFYKTNIPGKEIITNVPISALWKEYIFERHKLNCAITHAQRGPKKRLLDYIAKIHIQQHDVQLEKVSEFFVKDIKRIEAYDNSHLFGKHPYGVMIVFSKDTGFEKSAYRKFKVEESNDYDMMENMIQRRLKHEEWPLPDMMLIDGGVALVRMVKRYVPESVLVLGLAKGEKRKQDRLFDETGHEIKLTEPVKYLLQNVRDEAHRFAITTHKHSREKTAWKSMIDQIPGIGLKRKKVLIQHFGSAENVSKATVEELNHVKGITKILAETIYRYFR